MTLKYEVRHFLPGRVRLRVPALKHTEGLAEACVELLKHQQGVSDARVNRSCASVVIQYDARIPDFLTRLEQGLSLMTPQMLLALSAARKEPVNGTGPVHGADSEHRASIFTSGALKPLTLPSVALGVSLIGGALGTALSLPLIAYNAAPVIKRAFEVIKNERRLNVDFLDGLAIGISMLQGSLFTASFMTWLISLGDCIRDHTAARSRRVITDLLDYQGRKAWVVRGKRKSEVRVEEIVAGDVVAVYPGAMIPVDGTVAKGRAIIDQKTITGESMPVERSVGDKVYAATVVREGKLYLRTDRVGAETTAAQIVRLVEEAPVGETRIQNYAEKFADRLVAPTLGVAGAFYAASGDVDRLLSMLIIDFGTGIRVAAPTSVLASMIHAARQGIIIKGGSSIEKLTKVDTVVFDKTGTLTQGVPQVLDVTSYNDRRFPSRKVLALAAAAEARLTHPIAHAILAKAHQAEVVIPDRKDSKYHLGLGVEVQVNGYRVEVGSERFMRQNNVKLDAAIGDLRTLNRSGRSALLLAVDGDLTGLIPYADLLRPESLAVTATLRSRGISNIMMLTGDNPVAAQSVSDELGLDGFFSEVLPADKAEIVKQLQSEGRSVAMVGDGINDSPALSHADVGIAMKNGAEVARETADIVLLDENLWKVVSAIDLSREAMGLIKQNYAIIATLNALAFALAIPAGMARPGLTTLISNGSAILASVNAVRPVLRY
ncbi:MAG TPA: heavy metal translocating P-type ATPase [Blastocatellia bacterium]|nr:heavy metal translocating P-type ATPase [Blastocatellia bacterium]